jgi:hypothetical protein
MANFRDKVSFENVEAVFATASALKVKIDGTEYWIPQSQIHDDSEVYRAGDVGTLIISEWIASQKGIS